jgi:hypothetical protein
MNGCESHCRRAQAGERAEGGGRSTLPAWGLGGLWGGHAALSPRRLSERAGEPGLEGTLVPPQVQHSVLPQGPRGPADPRERHRPARLRGGPGLWAPAPICLQDPAQPAGGGHPGGERRRPERS